MPPPACPPPRISRRAGRSHAHELPVVHYLHMEPAPSLPQATPELPSGPLELCFANLDDRDVVNLGRVARGWSDAATAVICDRHGSHAKALMRMRIAAMDEAARTAPAMNPGLYKPVMHQQRRSSHLRLGRGFFMRDSEGRCMCGFCVNDRLRCPSC